MLKAHIIEPFISEYANYPVVVRKPVGSVRYCIDFRRLNAKKMFPPDLYRTKMSF